ncbi:1839_t:CDS:2, partial [Gigaspora margarita]
IRLNLGGAFILTTRHGVGKKGSSVCQPGMLGDNCTTITKYCSLRTDNNGHLIDYSLCRISNNHRVPENPNKLYITISDFNTSISGNSNNIIEVSKVGRNTFFTKGEMEVQYLQFLVLQEEFHL